MVEKNIVQILIYSLSLAMLRVYKYTVADTKRRYFSLCGTCSDFNYSAYIAVAFSSDELQYRHNVRMHQKKIYPSAIRLYYCVYVRCVFSTLHTSFYFISNYCQRMHTEWTIYEGCRMRARKKLMFRRIAQLTVDVPVYLRALM